jgi:hypothetical protein
MIVLVSLPPPLLFLCQLLVLLVLLLLIFPMLKHMVKSPFLHCIMLLMIRQLLLMVVLGPLCRPSC